MGLPSGSVVKNLPAQESWVPSLDWEDPLEEGMTTHSSIFARKILWTEERSGLYSMEFQSQTQLKRLNTHTNTHTQTHTHTKHPVIIKTLSPLGTGKNFLHLIQGIYEKINKWPHIEWWNTEHFLTKQGPRQKWCPSYLQLTKLLTWKILRNL